MNKEYKGQNGTTLILEEKQLIFKRKGVSAFFTHGLKGDKIIPYNSITAVQIKKAGTFTAGYIQMTLKGGAENKGGYIEAITDENTISFTNKKQNEKFEEAKSFIENKIHQKNNHSSSADELEKLSALKDKGILTQAEFDAKKKQILGL